MAAVLESKVYVHILQSILYYRPLYKKVRSYVNISSQYRGEEARRYKLPGFSGAEGGRGPVPTMLPMVLSFLVVSLFVDCEN